MKARGTLILILAGVSMSWGCSSPFSELQSARLVEKNHVEATAYYSAVSVSVDEENEKTQDDFGFQFAYGVSDKVNMRFRYERLSAVDLDSKYDVNVWSFGPKIRLGDDRYSLYLPLGFGTGEMIESQDTWEFHPTLLQTIGMNEYLEFNTSLKYLWRFDEDRDNAFAFNLGLGLGNDLTKIVFRPEAGILINPGEDGFFWHWSIGVSLFR
ncbi:MAG TPA: hypothetical protein VLA34_02365 [Candidatus Krumholzibacterium sp.]|nr:hypothetical protein [Candidatus Krumholzibacterium sp.]